MTSIIGVVNVRFFGLAENISSLIRDEDVKIEKFMTREDQPIDSIIEKLEDVDVIIAGAYPTYDRELFRRLKRLKAIVRWGVGYDNVSLEDATEEGVIVSRLPAQVLKDAVAEHTIALILAVMRKIPKAIEYVKSSSWWKNFLEEPDFLIGESIEDKIIGFIGLGEIGFRTLELIKPFRPKEIIVYDPYISKDFVRSVGAVYASSLDELLAFSDIISIHAPLTPETKKILNRERFQKMKKGVYLINTARGGIIDTDSLVWALEKGIVRAAALDVFDPEPIPPNHPILKFDNVILTPHLAFATKRSCKMMDEYSIAEALRILKGEKPLWILNPEVLKSDKLRAKIST